MDVQPILIVDDEVDLLELFSLGLRKLPFPVLTARDGTTALQLLEAHVPVVVILDIAMPYPNGLDLMRFVRSEPRFDSTKIVIFTAAPSRVSKPDADLADMIVAKPTTPRTLTEAVKTLISSVNS
ncbi:MAG: response regulator [Chloroflexota bacterium]